MSRAVGLGWIPDVPDMRDLVYTTRGVIKHEDNIVLPSQISLVAGCPPVYDQGELGSCTANAVGAMCQFVMHKQFGESFIPSRLFVYYCTREIERTIPVDSGATLRNTLKVVNNLGACKESTWDYIVGMFDKMPEMSAYLEASYYQALEYSRVPQTLKMMKRVLSEGYPFVFGFAVFDSLYDMDGSFTLPMPAPNHDMLGGHAVMAVGYDDLTQCFIIRNSWGEHWGDGGYFYMPYQYLLSDNLASDFWTVRLMENSK